MTVYCGIDLHASNSVVAIVDECGELIFSKRYPNELERILEGLSAFEDQIDSIVVESTFNWYWLVDGLMDQGFDVRLCNPAKAGRYDGLKYSDDFSDARWLAEMRRLDILPEGYIYPRSDRPVRDLLRRRGHLVRQRTTLLLSTQNLMQRNTGARISGNDIKRLCREHGEHGLSDPNLALAVEANGELVRAFDERIDAIERRVKSERRSNDKRKGDGERRAGNRYLCWAFVEAAHFARRYYRPVQRFYERKYARANGVVAIKAVAHKLARASFHVMRDEVAFDIERAF